MLAPAKEKFLHIVQLNIESLDHIFEYLSKNKTLLIDSLLNENSKVVENNSDILYQLISKAFEKDKEGFIIATQKKDEAKPMYKNLINVLEILIAIFPKIPSKYVSKVGSFLEMFNKLAKLGNEMLEYLVSKEIVFIFITYLLGKESPHYSDTLIKASDTWDLARGALAGQDYFIELIIDIYTLNEKGENKVNSIYINYFIEHNTHRKGFELLEIDCILEENLLEQRQIFLRTPI